MKNAGPYEKAECNSADRKIVKSVSSFFSYLKILDLRDRIIRFGRCPLYIGCVRRGIKMLSIGLGVAVFIAIKPVLKIYVILLIGYLAARYNILNAEITRGISNLVVNILIPSLTFNKIVQTLSNKDIKTIGVVILNALVLFALGGICSLLIHGLAPVPKRWFWGLIFAGIFPNISDLPIAYVQSMQNSGLFSMDDLNKGVAYICIFLTFQGFIFMNLGAYRIVGLDFRDSDDEERSKGDSKLRDIVHPMARQQVGSRNLSRNSFGSISHAAQAASSRGSRLTQEAAVIENAVSASSHHPDACTGFGEQAEDIDSPISHHANRAMDTALSLQFRDSPSALDTQTISVKSLPCHAVGESLQFENVCAPPATAYSICSRRTHERALGAELGRGSYSLPQALEVCPPNLAPHGYPVGEEQADRNAREQLFEDVSRVSSTNHTEKSGSAPSFKNSRRRWLYYIVMTCCRPASSGPLLGILCAMVPTLRALFVHNDLKLENAPDGQPVLNFIMDITEYLGNACVPTGLLLLGSTFANMRIESLPKGIWRAVLMLTSFKLVALPIIGILFAGELRNINWLHDDIGKFVIILTWTMPSTSAQVYFTTFFATADGHRLQMSLLSLFFMTQYAVLFFAMAFVVTYTIKFQLN
ncbi:AGL149Cp [Eremothecium gossypii ATCC 10895]|uniref:AGL149Cp n=1 Tax=Eremothecium gossypii (strain ATCC 10895 / CBS 109.51 / FGSC 9923 / NRRL Y-1056) TaxID=284811 RepID=Q750T8_EREGS|nr:AGL149Cp [Eremothecium gossypii ATCC 10895]AAS54342.1 AGL149Cp [Eremothecium gossypii ATCC 10895]AEY98669.1 FAGL149Cp [Eremothecium gossypii FDAG1]